MSIIPFALPSVPMLRIIGHWTAGGHKANATDKKAYHVLIEGDGEVIKGVAGIERNSGRLADGYAAHTLNCNTNSIGVSCCAMAAAVESPFNAGNYPITQTQWLQFVKVIAELAKFYKIPVTPKTILTHAEVQANLGIAQRNKWDIARLVFRPDLIGAKAIGDYLRECVEMEMKGAEMPKPANPQIPTIPNVEPVPEGAQGIVSTNGGNLTLRAMPSATSMARGSIPNGTELEVLQIQPEWLEIETPAGYTGWVARKWVRLVDGPKVGAPTTPNRARVLLSEIRSKLDELDKEL